MNNFWKKKRKENKERKKERKKLDLFFLFLVVDRTSLQEQAPK